MLVFSGFTAAYATLDGDYMGYKIVYEPQYERKYPAKKKSMLNIKPVIAILLCILIVILAAAPDVRQVLKEYLLPGDPLQTEEAAMDLYNDLRAGVGAKEAITTFCLEILDDAKE